MASVADTGVHAFTVADVVRRAKVSRAAFYAHFSDKEDCFLAATRHGGTLLFEAVGSATRGLPAATAPEDVLRAGCRAFLRFLADEPAFAKVFYIDMPAAGLAAMARVDNAQHRFAELNREWHERSRRRRPGWPHLPYEAYLGLAGATTQLVSMRVRRGRTADLLDLEDTLVALHLAVMTGRAWPAAGRTYRAGVVQDGVDRSVVDESAGEP